MSSDTSKRMYELDWLRVGAILVVFLYHSSRFFNLGDWHVKNGVNYVWVEIWNVFATRWMMPLFFVISGAGLFFALCRGGGFRRFYTDKFLRLFIPVLLAALSHGALQVYLERVSHGRFAGSFAQWLPGYFNGVYTGIGLSGAGNFANVGMHLWYLLFLFFYSLICYRLFVWLINGGQGLRKKVTRFLSLPGIMVPGFILPLVIMKAVIPASILDVGNGGWGFLYYLWFLIAGFIVVSDDRLLQRIADQRRILLVMGVVVSVTHLYLLFGVSSPAFQGTPGGWISALFSYLGAWCWVLAFLGFSMKYLAFDRPFLKKANEGVLPFFILHQTVLLIFGFYILNWQIHDALKWFLVSAVSFVLIVAVYWVLIRNSDLLRFLFGMKTQKAQYQIFRHMAVLILVPLLWVGLSVFAGVNQEPETGKDRIAMPLNYDQDRDILLNADTVTQLSQTGVQVVDDPEAATDRAIEFISGATLQIESAPVVYFDAAFNADAGRYFVWIRGKSDVDSELTDSIWLQADNQIGTGQGSVHLGNWNTFHPIGEYAWGSDVHIPYILLLRHSGRHTIRIQPRQIPHRIDQIWLSRAQRLIPDTMAPVR